MSGGRFLRSLRAGRVVLCAALVAGCAQLIQNDPVNLPLAANPRPIAAAQPPEPSTYDDMVVALAFSGGGARAAAFSYGVLTGFDQTQVTAGARRMSLLDHIDFLSGVSGGSIQADYYGLKRRQALADFKQRFLLANPEEGLETNLNLFNIARGLEGGINDSTRFPRWLDAHLFHNATYQQLLTRQRPVVWINASDIYNRTAFLFTPVTFRALCSDLTSYPVSLAVAASAAVPVIFAPVVIKNYPGGCPAALPEWVDRVYNDPNVAPIMKSYADALERYHTGAIKYVKLLDGGLVDNYGLAGITVTRLANRTPYGPLDPAEAVKLRRLLFLVVDSGRAPSGAWAQTVSGPTGVDLITAASDTATESGALGSYAEFKNTMDDWRKQLIAWRCRLSPSDRLRYRAPVGWNCRDVQFFIGRLAFDELGPKRAAELNAVETRLKLPPDQVEMVIAAGRDALYASPTFRSFLKSLRSAPPRSVPVASVMPPKRYAHAQ